MKHLDVKSSHVSGSLFFGLYGRKMIHPDPCNEWFSYVVLEDIKEILRISISIVITISNREPSDFSGLFLRFRRSNISFTRQSSCVIFRLSL